MTSFSIGKAILTVIQNTPGRILIPETVIHLRSGVLSWAAVTSAATIMMFAAYRGESFSSCCMERSSLGGFPLVPNSLYETSAT